ncbi:MAG: DUF3616 domain-containing protein [Verrucomicrobia bacterium]|nr:DUF3616 domain-containing protein [Verrucomicrobiota bacterium]
MRNALSQFRAARCGAMHTRPAPGLLGHALGWILALAAASGSVRAQPVISEILMNPAGTDVPHEYIEVRGTPNFTFPPGSYLVVLEGDTTSTPGTIDDLFDLGGRVVGGNGFLVWLQKNHLYTPHPNASVYANTGTGDGWGDGLSSSIGHWGNADVENGSKTFLLIQTTNPPLLGMDLDADDNGHPDHPDYAGWQVWDSVGVMDADPDLAYGRINFRLHPAGIATGTVVDVTFEIDYLGRFGHSTGASPADWIACGNVEGDAPYWFLRSPSTALPPSPMLNHVGAPNFGAPALPGVVARQSDGATVLAEGTGTDTYSLGLNTPPSGPVTIRMTALAPVQLSLDGGASWAASRTVTLTDTSFQTLTARALDDNVVDTSPNRRPIAHELLSTGDPDQYPLTVLMPVVPAEVTENDWLVLNELKVNPPGEDAPFEYVEVRGPPNATLRNLAVLAIDGDQSGNPGLAELVVDLDGDVLGGSGLMLIVAPGHPYLIFSGTTVHLAPSLALAGGALGNGTVSFLLVATSTRVAEGTDLDRGDNGTLERLPLDATVLDAVGWLDGDTNDLVFGGAVLTQAAGTPDAATRFTFNLTPNTAAAWFNGDLAGATGDGLIYDSATVSANFPYGAILTPGIFANSPPSISPLAPYSNVIGDATDPGIVFWVNDAETAPNDLVTTLSSSNPDVVPENRLILTLGEGGRRTLRPNPVGVGYATLTITVDDGDEIAQTTLEYAASAMGRTDGRFHRGISDASTSLALDDTLMLIGDDENQVIRIYDRQQSGGPQWETDFSTELHLIDLYDDGRPREVDIEGSTRVGNRLYWMGAHSHARNAESRTNRGRIFATDLSGAGTNIALAFRGHYDFLKLDLIVWDANNEHGKGAHYYGFAASAAEGTDPKAPDGSGFNLEGLCMAPGSLDTAYLAFRAPLIPATNRWKALIVPVTNFASLAVSYGDAGSARFGPPIELDLNGHGIRSLAGGPEGYLLVAGPPDVATDVWPKDFELYTWSGQPHDPPELRAADLSSLIPEGIVALPPAPWTTTSQVQLVSDSGVMVFYGDGQQAKFLPVPNFKKFRSDWITLGPVVIPPPRIWSLAPATNGFWLTWKAVAGQRYQVQSRADLSAPWQDVAGEVTASNVLACKWLPAEPACQQFYRVARLP